VRTGGRAARRARHDRHFSAASSFQIGVLRGRRIASSGRWRASRTTTAKGKGVRRCPSSLRHAALSQTGYDVLFSGHTSSMARKPFLFLRPSFFHLNIKVCCSLSTDHDLNLLRKLCPKRIVAFTEAMLPTTFSTVLFPTFNDRMRKR
jgi:hypothetical protein